MRPHMRGGVAAAVVLLLLTHSAGAQERRRRAAPAPVSEESPLLEADLYRLYPRELRNRPWCDDSKDDVYLTAVFRVDDDFVFNADPEFRKRFEEEILPVVREHCVHATKAVLAIYVEGVLIERNEIARGAALQGSSLTSIGIDFSDPDDIRYSYYTSHRSVAGLATEYAGRNRSDATLAAAGAIRAAANAADDAVQAADEERNAKLAAVDVTSDGKLKIGGTSPRSKNILTQAYGRELIRPAHADMPFVPYSMFAGLVQAYSELCRSSLPANAASFDHISTRYTGSSFGILMKTDYYEEYVSKTVWMDPRYEAAYRNAIPMIADKLWQQWVSGPNPLPIFYFNSREVGLVELAEDARSVVKNNGCKSAATKKLLDHLQLFVADEWSTKTAEGGYRFADVEGEDATLRYYAKVPSAFSPAFPVPKTGRMKIILREDEKTPGLEWIAISYLPQFRGAPDYVQEAVENRKYFVVQCQYYVDRDWWDAFYWNANGPVPSVAVQEFLKNLIREPRNTCPPEYVSR